MSEEILKVEEYLPEDDMPEQEPVTIEQPKKTGRSIRSEAQLKALERGRQRALEKRETERKTKELEQAKKIIAEQQPPEPVKQSEPVPSPPKPILERKDGRFYLV